jgi:gliding motility-associated-like protein
MSGRVLTPNGDGINDSVAFTLASTPLSTPRAQVFDVRGRRIAELASLSPEKLRWDGKDYSGRAVESGIYLVQITEDQFLWNGVVAVAH